MFDPGRPEVPSTAGWFRLGALVAVIAALIVVGVRVGLPDVEQIRAALAHFNRWWAAVVFACLYAVATLSPLPKTVLTLGSGVLFGLPLGLVVVVVGASIGGASAFGLGRVLGRDTVHRWTGVRLDRFDDQLLRRGFLAILVARLIPIVPFTAVNYLAGVSAVRFRDFAAATVIGILPATSAYVAVGAFGDEPGSWPFLAALAALAVLTIAGGIAAVVHRRSARRVRD